MSDLAARPRTRRSRGWSTAPSLWRFAFPALLVYGLLYVGPALLGFAASFTRWQGLGSEVSFAGIANFRRLLFDPAFQRSFLNTIVLMVVGLLGIVLLTLVAMLVLQQMRGRRIIRVVVFVPYLVSPIALGVAFGFLLDPNGMLNALLGAVGLGDLKQAWLGPGLVFQSVIFAVTWSLAGLAIVLLVANIDSIPATLYEAADLAGATAVQRLRYVTLPLSRSVAGMVVSLCMIQLMKVFDIVYTLTGATGAPVPQARTYAVEQYLTMSPALGGAPDFGYGSAMAVVFVALVTALAASVGRLLRTKNLEF